MQQCRLRRKHLIHMLGTYCNSRPLVCADTWCLVPSRLLGCHRLKNKMTEILWTKVPGKTAKTCSLFFPLLSPPAQHFSDSFTEKQCTQLRYFGTLATVTIQQSLGFNLAFLLKSGVVYGGGVWSRYWFVDATVSVPFTYMKIVIGWSFWQLSLLLILFYHFTGCLFW